MLSSTYSLTSTILGAGILSIPLAFQDVGLVGGRADWCGQRGAARRTRVAAHQCVGRGGGRRGP